MTDKIIITDKNKFPDRFMQPDSTQTDKKENKICRRFAFLKISCKRTLHTFAFAQPHRAYTSQKQKSAILPTRIFISFILYWCNLTDIKHIKV